MAQDAHNEALRIFNEVNMVENALIKQVSAAIPDLYLKQFQNVHSHAITTPLATLLSQLMTTYGRVDEIELQHVTSEFKKSLQAH